MLLCFSVGADEVFGKLFGKVELLRKVCEVWGKIFGKVEAELLEGDICSVGVFGILIVPGWILIFV